MTNHITKFMVDLKLDFYIILFRFQQVAAETDDF